MYKAKLMNYNPLMEQLKEICDQIHTTEKTLCKLLREAEELRRKIKEQR